MKNVEEILQYIKSELDNDDVEIYLDVDDYKVIVEALEKQPCKKRKWEYERLHRKWLKAEMDGEE